MKTAGCDPLEPRALWDALGGDLGGPKYAGSQGGGTHGIGGNEQSRDGASALAPSGPRPF